VVGFIALFLVNAAFLLFFGSQFLSDNKNLNFPVATLTLVLCAHFIGFILIFLTFSQYNVKVTAAYGTTVNLPEKYREQLTIFKTIMMILFCFSTILLALLVSGYAKNNNYDLSFLPMTLDKNLMIWPLCVIMCGLSLGQMFFTHLFVNLKYKTLTL